MIKVQFDHFYSYNELEDFLLEASRLFPQRIKLETLAKTQEGKKIFLAKITNFETTNHPDRRSAYYVQSGLHAEEAAGTTAALHLIKTLLTNPDATNLLNDIIFYVIPRVNPDGVEYSISKCAAIRSKFEKIEGLPNAIIPTDLNNDGMILNMRIEDPLGNMIDYNNTGIMLARKSEDKGPFYNVFIEGIIENYDGGSLQLGNRSIDFNRSLPTNWLATSNAEDYPCRGIETRTIIEFMVTHKNIFACIDYHCGSCGILRPLMSDDHDLCETDRHTIIDIGKLAEKITGLPLIHEREYKDPDDDPDIPYGCSNEWAYHALGISSYVIELGNGFNSIGLDTNEILKNWRFVENSDWLTKIINKHNLFSSEIMVPWQEFDHPQLGKIEIGGFKNGLAYYMYPPDMEHVIPKTTEFLLTHSKMGPKLALGNVEKINIGANNYRIRVECMNIGRFGTTIMVGASGFNAKKDVYVSIEGDGIDIISRPFIYTYKQLDSMQKEYLEWFVHGNSGSQVTITASHPKCTPTSISVIL